MWAQGYLIFYLIQRSCKIQKFVCEFFMENKADQHRMAKQNPSVVVCAWLRLSLADPELCERGPVSPIKQVCTTLCHPSVTDNTENVDTTLSSNNSDQLSKR